MAIKTPLGRSKHNDNWNNRYSHGLTPKQAAQFKAGKSCGICGEVKPVMVVDHDHGTGELRGVLCNTCNLGLGKLGDSIEGLERAIAYLRQSNAQ